MKAAMFVLLFAASASYGQVCPSGNCPKGYHEHTDSTGFTWRHSNTNVGKVAPHVSPKTKELVWERSADGNTGYKRMPAVDGPVTVYAPAATSVVRYTATRGVWYYGSGRRVGIVGRIVRRIFGR